MVTRAAHQAGGLVELLSSRGAHAIVMPLLTVEEPEDGGRSRDEMLGGLADFDWVVVTSPNGASRVAPFLRGEAAPAVAVVGRATEAVLGRPATLVASPARADALVEQFPTGRGRVLVVQGNLADDTVRDGLASRGWEVTVVVAYRTTRPSPDADAMMEALAADVLLLASGSAARGWHGIFGRRTPPVVVCIGPSTAAEAAALGIDVTATAEHQSIEAMVDCAERALAAQPRGTNGTRRP